MHSEPASPKQRALRHQNLSADLVVVGGGLAGACTAIAAAREGIKVILVQDRPVLGGNTSSEVRLWALGATSHMGNNNRWAREGGVIGEILEENMFINPEGNPMVFDPLLLDKVVREPNITLLLNTPVEACEESDVDTIKSVSAFNAQNSTTYTLSAPLFCDASGDGILGFLSGAAFRIGSESKKDFGELMAPETANSEMLGHSIFFYTRDTGKPVEFTPPSFALKDINEIPRHKEINAREHGCKFWWLEYGGTLDTVHDTEAIKWELWKIAYGVWNHIKNSGKFPEAANLTLEWVGTIPGKRESRRFEGDYMLIQQDIIEQRVHDDDVSFGGWAIDLHPAQGVYSDKPGCSQWHAKGVFPIPYRTLFSKNIKNLFLGGRIISASHIAFGSTRVMCTCGHNGAVVGIAAAICKKDGLLPCDLSSGAKLRELRQKLLKTGHYIPNIPLDQSANLANQATITASSTAQIQTLPADGPEQALDFAWAQMLPLRANTDIPKMTLRVTASEATTLETQLRVSDKPRNHTPNLTLAKQNIELKAGPQNITLDFPGAAISENTYAFYCLMANPKVTFATSETRLTGLLSVCQKYNPAVAKSSAQIPPPNSGVDAFEYWCPVRRPEGRNFAFTLDKAPEAYSEKSLLNGILRPVEQSNAWAASADDKLPSLDIAWDQPRTISKITLTFDTDLDHPMENVQWGHPERIAPFCVRNYRILDANGAVLAEVKNNHEANRTHILEVPVSTKSLRIELEHPSSQTPAALFQVWVE